jgi:nitroreductase
MNETLKTLIERRSCRSYKPDPIPADILDQILEAGTYAATGMGRQSPIMIAVTDQETRNRLSRMNADVMGYVKQHKMYFREPKDGKILALSTCASANDIDRFVVFANIIGID